MKDNKGSALAFVLIIMAVLTILCVAFLQVGLAETTHATRSEKQLQIQYIARSGVEVGYTKLISASLVATDIDALVASANSFSNITDQVLGKGKYSIVYEAYPSLNPQFIKIRSSAVSALGAPVTDQVTLLVSVTSSSSNWTLDPQEWKRSMNMWPGISPSNPDENFVGKAVKFTSSPTKSPQNGSASVFRSSVMMFSGMDNKGITFQQQPQTNDITFDAEVILFYGKSYLRNSSGHVNLAISPDTVADSTVSPWTSSISKGFEDRSRYLEYVGSGTANQNYFDMVLVPKFTPGKMYGLVYFQDDVVTNSSTIKSAGWYYYPHDTDLLSGLDRGAMIEIESSDPIIEATLNKQVGNVKVSSNKIEYGDE